MHARVGPRCRHSAPPRARTPVGRRIRNRFEREETCAGIERKWSAKPLAEWRRDERKPRPAGRAKTGPLDRLAASRAQLRKRHTERKRTCGAKSPAQTRQTSRFAFGLGRFDQHASHVMPRESGDRQYTKCDAPCAVDGPKSGELRAGALAAHGAQLHGAVRDGETEGSSDRPLHQANLAAMRAHQLGRNREAEPGAAGAR